MSELVKPNDQVTMGLGLLMQSQWVFEQLIRAEDGSLWEFNTPEHILERGIIGEGKEALEAIREGQLEEAKEEAVDVFIFLASLFNHLGMTPMDVYELTRKKMSLNFVKYANPSNYNGSVENGLSKSREVWKRPTDT